jgi:O-antigen/teichoic acid export membrane protein
MLIAAIKLADIAARSLFVLVVLYSLAARETGQFGLALTLSSLFGFASGFERYVDLQRRLVDQSDQQVDRLLVSALRFFGVNYIVWLPVLVALFAWWAQLGVAATALFTVVAIGEHLSNEIYRMAIIAPRHRHTLIVVLIKNLALLAVSVGMALHQPAAFDLQTFLAIWAALSMASVLVAAFLFRRGGSPHGEQAESLPRLVEHYRHSRTHFLVGLVAVLSLQVDRLIVGAVLDLELAGVYFRHIVLASVVYQAAGVLSHNRILARVYNTALSRNMASVKEIVQREVRAMVPLTLLLIGGVLSLGAVGITELPRLRGLQPSYLAALMFGFLLRALADYNSLVLNAAYRERDIFKSQLIALAVSVPANILLTKLYGPWGTILSVNLSAACYLIAMTLHANQALKWQPQTQ